MTSAAVASAPPDIFRSGKREGRLFLGLCWLSTWSSVGVLIVLLSGVLYQAAGWLDWQFLTSFDSRVPAKAGILAGLVGTTWTIIITILVSVPIGVGAAIYLEEFGRDNWLSRLIEINLANLAGVPSIVFGLLGLTAFVEMFGLFDEGTGDDFDVLGLKIPLPLGKCVMAGALTLALMILPVIIVASREALRAVPPSLRHASLALGATRWQTVRHQVLPSALPGILTGIILAVSRAMGEAAPLILVGATTFVMFAPGNVDSPRDVIDNPGGLLEAPFDTFTVMPIQIFNWVQSRRDFREHVAASGIVVLLVLLLVLNALAIYIRNRSQKRLRY